MRDIRTLPCDAAEAGNGGPGTSLTYRASSRPYQASMIIFMALDTRSRDCILCEFENLKRRLAKRRVRPGFSHNAEG